METEERFIAIETALSNLEKVVDELNAVIIEQGRKIDVLNKQNQFLLNVLNEDVVKPLSEETPPPHY